MIFAGSYNLKKKKSCFAGIIFFTNQAGMFGKKKIFEKVLKFLTSVFADGAIFPSLTA